MTERSGVDPLMFLVFVSSRPVPDFLPADRNKAALCLLTPSATLAI